MGYRMKNRFYPQRLMRGIEKMSIRIQRDESQQRDHEGIQVGQLIQTRMGARE